MAVSHFSFNLPDRRKRRTNLSRMKIKQGIQQGFTLIEVMVATAVLLIMIVMIGTLFTQSSSAWDAGYARAEGGMIVRGVVGAITRDMNTLIDGRPFGQFGDQPLELSDSSLSFVCLKNNEDTDEREPRLIEYTAGSSVVRTEYALTRTGSSTPASWSRRQLSSTTLHDNGNTSNDQMGNSYAASFKFVPVEKPADNLIYSGNTQKRTSFENTGEFKDKIAWQDVIGVKIRLELTRTGSYSSLEVKSLGPDGEDNSSSSSTKKDDIIIR